jgi:hypothetical protein
MLIRFRVKPMGRALAASVASLVIAQAASALPSATMPASSAAASDRMTAVKPTLRAETIAATRDQPAKIRIVGSAAEQIEAAPKSGGPPGTKPPEIKLEAGKPTLAISAGSQVIVRKLESTPAVTVPLSITKQALPGSVILGVKDQDNQTVGKQLQPFVAAERLPLLWDAEAASYVTTLVVGLDAVSDGAEPPPKLQDSVVFQLTGRFVDRIEPSRFAVQASGPSGYQQVKLIAKDFSHAIEISAHSDFGDKSFSGDIDPGRILDLGKSNDRIEGLGIGSAIITVVQRASNGAPLTATSLLGIDLTTTAGRLEPTQAIIRPNESRAQVTLTSSGFGDATVSLAGAVHADAPKIQVSFVLPWLKLALALAGGLAAGFLRARKPKTSQLRAFFTSAVTGLVVDCLLAVGAPLAGDWATAAIRADLAWPAIALVAGYGGEPLLRRLLDMMFVWFKASDKKVNDGVAPTRVK